MAGVVEFMELKKSQVAANKRDVENVSIITSIVELLSFWCFSRDAVGCSSRTTVCYANEEMSNEKQMKSGFELVNNGFR